MNLTELKLKIVDENLNSNLLLVNDSRVCELYNQLSIPHGITLNRTLNNDFQVFVHDERGYRIEIHENLTEEQACNLVLSALRKNTKILVEFDMLMKSRCGKK